jgi:DNA-binding MarR family transcriptional regulator/GNAT superfamily N-acetyltransferase
MDDRIARIRAFNRVITRRLGALDASFLGCGLSLGKARLLYEIGSGVNEVRRLRAQLGLDSGHMSRMLRSLEKRRLVETTVDAADARARIVRLTKAGRAKLDELDRKSNEGAQSWLAPLGEERQVELQAAMDEVVRLLTASEVAIAPEDPRSETAAWCFDQFFRELDARFAGGFDPGLTASASPAEIMPPNGAFLVATLPGQPVGCAALKLSDRGKVGEVKRMWVSQEVRGLGVGRRLLESLEALARRSGVARLRLSTNRSLVEAQALYRASGFHEVDLFDDDPYAQLAFEKLLD